MRGRCLAMLALLLAGLAQGQVPFLPDLTVQAPGLAPNAPRAGDAVTFNVTVVNQGTGPAAAVRVAFTLDGAPLEGFGPFPMAPGERVNVSSLRPWTAVPGLHEFRAVVDPSGETPETNETNNEVRLNFTVSGTPDLRIASFVRSPAQPRQGDRVAFTATVENAGGPAGPFRARLRLDGQDLLTASLAGLGAGERVDVTAHWTAQQGAHVALAEADPFGEVAESDESNNNATMPFAVGPAEPRPNLVVADIRWTPAQPAHGDRVAFEARVRNAGSAVADASATRFRVDGNLLGDAPTPLLTPGAEAWVAAPTWFAIAGAHTVTADADANQQVAETDEGDNARAEAVQVAPAPGMADLVVELLTVSPAQPSEGQSLTFTAHVRNGGTFPAPPFRVDFRVDGLALGSAAVAGLAGGASVEVSSPAWTATAGEHHATAFADAGQQVTEANEGNNEGTLAFTASPARANLVIDTLRSQPAAPAPGQLTTFHAMVRNSGTAAAGPFAVSFRVDGEEVADVGVPGLAAGASLLVDSPPWLARQGARLARGIADAGQQVMEAREDDNERALALASLSNLPNLVVEALVSSPERPVPGTQVLLVAVVANLGSAPSGPTDVLFEVGARSATAGVAGLAAGGRASVLSPAFEFAGSAEARAIADASGAIAELSEEDNARALRVEAAAPQPTGPTTLPAAPILGPLQVTPAQPAPGDLVRVRAEVDGGGSASTDLAARLLVDDQEVDRAPLGALGPGSKVTASLAWRATSGTHTLRVELLRGSEVLASAPPRTLTVASERTEGFAAPILVAALAAAVVLLAAVGARRAR